MTLFALQLSMNRLDWTTWLLKSLWNSSNVIIHISCDMELYEVCKIHSNRYGRYITCKSCLSSVITCDRAPSFSHQQMLTEALMISPNLWAKSSSLLIALPSTAMLGCTGRRGMGSMVRIIHSRHAYASKRPRRWRSESTIFLDVV